MAALKVLFIGGTGTISSACAERAVAVGIDLTILKRGVTSGAIPGAQTITSDVRDIAQTRAALDGRSFDVVVDFVAFTPEHVRADIDLFTGRIGQYIFISSASAYQKPLARLPIVESTPLRNSEWQYSRDKIACEDLLVQAYRSGFPATIVRPSHTYAPSSVPLIGGRTALERMRRGDSVVVPGDGTSLWVLTHHTDFAKAFTGLLGNPQAIGDSFHITSDEVLTWNQIYMTLGAAIGVEPSLVHATSTAIGAVLPDLGPGLLGDKSHSVIFDNSKVKALVPDYRAVIPFAVGAREIAAWDQAHRDEFTMDEKLNKGFDRLIAAAAD